MSVILQWQIAVPSYLYLTLQLPGLITLIALIALTILGVSVVAVTLQPLNKSAWLNSQENGPVFFPKSPFSFLHRESPDSSDYQYYHWNQEFWGKSLKGKKKSVFSNWSLLLIADLVKEQWFTNDQKMFKKWLWLYNSKWKVLHVTFWN